MAVGSIPDAPYDPANATSYGDNFYPAQNDPNKTTIPARPAPPTTANLWEAIKMTRLEEFTPAKLAGIPCMRTSILYGVAGGVGVAALRLITGKRKGPRLAFSAVTYFVYSFGLIGGASNVYCNYRRNRELELLRLLSERFPERNIANMARRVDPETGEVILAPTPAASLTSRETVDAGKQKQSLPEEISALLGGKQPGLGKTPPPSTAKQPASYVEVRDASGQVVGRMSKGAAEVAQARGARESFDSYEVTSALAKNTEGVAEESREEGKKKSGWTRYLKWW